MIAILRLEAIGNNFAARRLSITQAMRRVHRVPPEQRSDFVAPKRPWVAKIGPMFSREFVRGKMCSVDSDAIGARGVFFMYHLDDGAVYEVFELTGWGTNRRYFCRNDAGSVVEMTREEVDQWLLTGSAR